MIRKFFAAAAVLAIACMSVISCGKDEPQDIDNTNYIMTFGVGISEKTPPLSQAQQDLVEIIVEIYRQNFLKLAGYTPVNMTSNPEDSKYIFRLSNVTLVPAAKLVQEACLASEKDLDGLKPYVDIETDVDFCFNFMVMYQGSDGKWGNVYNKIFGEQYTIY